MSMLPLTTAWRPRGMGGGWGRLARVICATVMIAAVAGCSGSGLKASYKPVLLPVKLEVDRSGVQITGEQSLVTPLGVFSIGAAYSLDDPDDALTVVIRDAGPNPDDPRVVGFDRIYRVRSGTGEFTAIVNGTATIQIADRRVLIDVTRGDVRTIEFRNAQATVQQGAPGVADRWQAFWDDCFYSPMALSRWAYDDSTMGDYYGLGFVWFLLRLLAAIVLGVVDLILVVATFLAAVAYTFLGQTARNIVYGVEALALAFLLLLGWAASDV
ncbi:hypothetical protein GCM10010149_64050 [Nonomuraea roseoviolacea subsp. roseoviolacea]|uniref:hypothetical protein n=1 Tax=Nonomuraea roseoviolacea TaxID=103837 RepID=UPI0031E3DC6C